MRVYPVDALMRRVKNGRVSQRVTCSECRAVEPPYCRVNVISVPGGAYLGEASLVTRTGPGTSGSGVGVTVKVIVMVGVKVLVLEKVWVNVSDAIGVSVAVLVIVAVGVAVPDSVLVAVPVWLGPIV